MLDSEMVQAFLPIWKEDEREQINHRIVDAGNILKNLARLFAFRLPFIVYPAVFWQSGISKAVVLKVIGYHYFLLRVYENLTDKEDFRSLGNECYCSSEELTVPNIYRNAKGFFFPVIFLCWVAIWDVCAYVSLSMSVLELEYVLTPLIITSSLSVQF